MQNERPRLSLSWEPLDLVSELINVGLLLLMWGLVVVNYGNLPETIPIHFNAAGKADDFGSKAVIWILPGIATLTYILLFVLNKFPHLHNYMVNITEENAENNYRLSTRLLRYINTLCLIIIGLLVYEILSLAKGQDPMILGYGFIAFTLIAPLIMIVIAFRLGKKINR